MTPFYYNSSLSNLPDATRDIVFKAVDKAIQRIRRALQVVPVSGNLFAERVCTATLTTTPPVCHSIAENHLCLEMPIPDGHFASLRYCDKCTSNGCTADACIVSPAGTGVPNTDFLNYVRVEDTDDCRSSSTLAYASTCQQDQYDRPTFGVTNFSPKKLSTSDSAFEHQVSTALHELLHTLDFSSRFFPLMRYEDVTPRTPRDEQGNPPIFNAGTCPNGKQIDYYVEPANTTINYSTERDHVVAKLVTPRVRAFVQDHAICSTLVSTELESQDGGCIGSHCEERLFEPEYMTPVDSYHARLLRRFRLVSSQRLDLRGHALWSKERMLLRNGEVCRSGDAESDSCGPFYGMTPSTECQRCSVDATSRAVCFFEH
ncbi:hypothetical protein PC116_g26391 [Phytophthora cactorum]|nr:hypothetical protein PC116_g26391 [Phytophthora cactorum]